MDKTIEILRNSVDSVDLPSLLKGLETQNDRRVISPESLQLYSILIDKVADSFDLSYLCCTIPGISALVGQLNLLLRGKDNADLDQVRRYKGRCRVLYDLLCRILMSSQSLVFDFWKECATTPLRKELEALFVGSRIQNVLIQVEFFLDNKSQETTSFNYPKWLAGQMEMCLDLPDIDDMIFLSIKTTGIERYVCHLDKFVRVLEKLRESKRKTVLKSHVLPLLERRLRSSNLLLIASVLARLFAAAGNDLVLTEYAEKSSLLFRRAAVVSVVSNGRTDEVFNLLISRWCDEIIIKHLQFVQQENLTELLVLLLPHASSLCLFTISKSSSYLQSISARLSSTSELTRTLAIVFAQGLSGRVDKKPLDFGVEIESGDHWKEIMSLRDEPSSFSETDFRKEFPVPEMSMKYCPLVPVEYAINSHEDTRYNKPENQSSFLLEAIDQKGDNLFIGNANDNLLVSETGIKNEKQLVEEVNLKKNGGPLIIDLGDIGTEKKPFKKPLIMDLTDESSLEQNQFRLYEMPSDDEEDSEEDPTLIDRKAVKRKPIFVRELVQYLKDEDDSNKQTLALQVASDLIRQKANYGQEVSMYAQDLVVILCGIRDQCNITHFEELRIRALQALCVSETEVLTTICKALGSGDYSLQQRLSILSVINLSCQELSGVPVQNEVVVGKTLPSNVQQAFTDQVSLTIQSEVLKDIKEQAKDVVIGGPKVVRVSKRLEKKAEVKRTNILANIGARKVFWPLLIQWHGIANGGIYSDLYRGQMVKTLGIILHYCAPSAREIPEMSADILQIVVEQLSAATDSALIEGIMFAVMVVLEVCNHEYLAQSFGSQLLQIQSWLNERWEMIPDERIRSLALGVLLQLNEVLSSFERRLLDRMTGLGL